MRKLLLSLVALAALATTITFAAPANAATTDHRACVTASEWNQVHARMSQGRVSQILDGRGTLWFADYDSGYNDQWRTYRPCASFGSNQPLVVWYDNYSYSGWGYQVWDKYRSSNHDMPRP
jgi:hypothetical protein